jgi:hypothetical protein
LIPEDSGVGFLPASLPGLEVPQIDARHAIVRRKRNEPESNQPIHLRGVVTRFGFQDPHTWIHMDVKDEKGNVTNWAVEGGTSNVLIRKGVTKNSLPIGTEIVVDGFRAKDGSFRANGLDVTFADGREILLGSSAPGTPQDK